MPSNVFNWDELNIIREDAKILFGRQQKPSKKELEEFCDYLEFVLCLVYAYGWHDAEEIVGIVPMTDGLDDKTVNLEIDHMTFRNRLMEKEHSAEEAIRLIDTESHRDYNTAVYDAAKKSGKKGLHKTWYTMMDERVRDQHRYLHGMKVGIDDLFYTPDGDSAMYPGGFELPDNNVNCRCYVVLTA